MEFEREVIDRLARIEQDLKSLGGVAKKLGDSEKAIAVIQTDVRDHERRIINIEGWGKWLALTVGALVIGSIWQLMVR